MPSNIFQKGINLLMRRQTNILSAAFIIMATTFLSYIFGLIKKRLLVAIFGASNVVGVYDIATKFPDTVFQLIIAAAISSAFIPIFSRFLTNNREKEGQEMASNLLTVGLIIFGIVSLILGIFAPFILQLFNPGAGFSASEMILMTNLMRIIIFGQLLFVVAIFFSALLQTYNHFLIPGLAAATYNVGIILGILFLYKATGIYSAAYGAIIGASLYILVQLPTIKKVGFSFKPIFSFRTDGVIETAKLMWPRTISLAVFQSSSMVIISLISFMPDSARNYVIFDLAQSLMFVPVALVGQSIAQAAFPVLAREREKIAEFKQTLLTSFNQILYLILPISVLFLVLRIPIVRLLYGAGRFDWAATVLTGRTLAFFSISLFAQALTNLISRGFYAIHDTKIPLVVGAITTVFMIIQGFASVFFFHMGIVSIAFAYSVGSILNFLLLFFLLERKIGGFEKAKLFFALSKIFLATICTGFALYIPIKLLDRLVFDTTKTINLLLLTGISSLAGLSLYLFLTWLFNVKEASTFLLLFKKLGNWREILGRTEETLAPSQFKSS